MLLGNGGSLIIVIVDNFGCTLTMRRQSSGRRAHHSFMLSGFSADRKVQLCTKVKSLGGIYNETDVSIVQMCSPVNKKNKYNVIPFM